MSARAQDRILREQYLTKVERKCKVGDLTAFPGTRLEALKGSGSGQWSIRINDQWRICFRWQENDAHHVEIVDYH